MNEEHKPIEAKTFEYEGKKYKYDFYQLTIEQAELAREAGEFKYNQLQAGAESFRQIVKSGGAEWLTIVARYLLREMKDNAKQPFNKDKAEIETEQFIKSLPIKHLNNLKECVSDFFTGIGKKPLVSAILQGERKKNGIEMLLPIFQKTVQGSLDKEG